MDAISRMVRKEKHGFGGDDIKESLQNVLRRVAPRLLVPHVRPLPCNGRQT